jgi:hypothetical protein
MQTCRDISPRLARNTLTIVRAKAENAFAMTTDQANPIVRTLSVFISLLIAGRLAAAPERGLQKTPSPVTAVGAESLEGIKYSTGFIDAIMAARAGNYYSTTQKVNGYTADLAAEAYSIGRWLAEEGYDDKDVVPLDDDFLPFRVSVLGSYADNPWMLHGGHEESSLLLGLGIRTFNTLQRGKLYGYLGFNMDNYYLEDHLYSRDGGDSYLKDFTLNSGALYKFTDSCALHSRAQYDYTSFGTFGLGATQPGLLNSDVFRYNSSYQLRYRFDGRGLNDPGIGLSTSFGTNGYDEAGGNYGDFYRPLFSQEVAYNPGGPLTYYVQGRLGWTDYRSLGDYDADIYAGLLGVRGTCPNCGFTFDAAAGLESYSYDYHSLNDRTVFRAEVSAEGKLTDQIGLRVTAVYGIHSLLPNAGTGLIDAEGFRGQLRATYSLNENVTFGLYGEYQDLKGDIHSGAADTDQRYYVVGADVNYRIADGIYLTPGIIYMDQNGDGQDADNFIGTIRTTFTF